MNREIKFRIWSEQSKKFITDEYEVFNPKLNDIFLNKRIVFQQFTGLQDKNGKEIYEGDIICVNGTKDELKDWIKPVEFIAGRFGYDVQYSEECYFVSICDDYGDDKKDIKIIGNIFENPELLK